MADNNTFEKALDLMIDDALKQIIENENASLPPSEEVTFSKEHEEQMKKLFAKLRRDSFVKKAVIYGKRAACICLIAFALAAVSIVSVDAWRSKFIKLIYDENAPNSDYSFLDSASGYNNEHVSLAYLPQGFELSKETITSFETILRFQNDDLFFKISISDLNMQFNTDTENATVEQITIQGYDAIGIYKSDLNQVIWSDNEKAFHVAGNLPRKEIEKIAQNCKKN